MDSYSYISNAHGSYIDQLYADYKKDPDSVDESWQKFFEGFEFSLEKGFNGTAVEAEVSDKETAVRNLIHAYRSRAHLKVGQEIGLGKVSLRKIVEHLDTVYLGHIGYEYMHIRDAEILQWFKDKCESAGADTEPDRVQKNRILQKLNEAVVFENFLHTKFLGQKRFSLEGGENTIPALDTILTKASEMDVKEIVIGMAHRGRLNVLANIMGKTYEEIFSEFEGTTDPDLTMGDGDVKYHLGYSSQITTPSDKEVYVKLTPNPSHLEAVDPVVLGYTRGQIDDEYHGDLKKAMSVLIHGDAALAGQGIVYEIVQMSQLPGYETGGTIHFVINNQVGFTTD
ncbi:MAG: thiamine pyrophosphate-dependent enzyme, partial [Cyclobacteriaceae bacterium]